MHETRDEYVKEMQNKIKDLRVELEELNKKAGDMTDDLKAEARQKYNNLKDELSELERVVDKIKGITDDSWTKVRDDAKEMWNRLKSAFDKA